VVGGIWVGLGFFRFLVGGVGGGVSSPSSSSSSEKCVVRVEACRRGRVIDDGIAADVWGGVASSVDRVEVARRRVREAGVDEGPAAAGGGKGPVSISSTTSNDPARL
jgi:hypothetical protein